MLSFFGVDKISCVIFVNITSNAFVHAKGSKLIVAITVIIYTCLRSRVSSIERLQIGDEGLRRSKRVRHSSTLSRQLCNKRVLAPRCSSQRILGR
jgi:hypothetical protein